MTHIDDWIEEVYDCTEGEKYAKFVLMLARLPASMKYAFFPWIQKFPLYCTYDGFRYRCTGASRLGDVWLAKDLTRISGYDLRVDVAKCTEWSDMP